MILSVVIPCYNREHCIDRALSYFNDSFFLENEVILVDDASTDSIKSKIANNYPLVSYIKHTKNKGAAAARNTGIKAAKGEYIAFLDSDDEWCEGKIDQQLSSFQKESSQNKKIMASLTNFTLIYPDSSHKQTRFSKQKNWFSYFLKGCFIGPGTTLIVKKEAYKKIGYYDESLPRLEDWDWLLRFSKHYDFNFVEEPLAKIYIHKGQSSKKIMESLLILEKKWSHLKGQDNEEFKLSILTEHLSLLKRDHPIKFILKLLKSIFLFPNLFKRKFNR